MFNLIAKTNLRVLVLSKNFFIECSNDKQSPKYIHGLKQSIDEAIYKVNNQTNKGGCVPICDFVIMKKHVHGDHEYTIETENGKKVHK